MANLPESSTFDEGVYQIETSDPVIGGPSGVSNFQAKTLANRTRYLKDAVDVLQDDMDAAQSDIQTLYTSNAAKAPLNSAELTGTPAAPTPPTSDNSTRIANTAFVKAAIAALIDSSPAALDTLNELAAALGDDPNFATTVTNALAEKAPIESPFFTNAPKGPTPSPFDNGFNLATTQFVQRALGNHRSAIVQNTNFTVSNTHTGSFIKLSGTVTGVQLPSTASFPVGAAVEFIAESACDIYAPSGESIGIGVIDSGSAISLAANDTVKIVNINGIWTIVGGSLYDKIILLSNASKNTTGFQKLPSGVIIQWGTVGASSSSAGVSTSFPIAFPNECSSVQLTPSASSSGYMSSVQAISASSFVSSIYSSTSVRAAGITAYYLAIGY